VRSADLFLAVLGLYLALALGVSAWRRRAEPGGGLPFWVAAWGAWAIAVGPRWLPATSPAGGLIAAGAWLFVSLLLLATGSVLASRGTPRAWLWLLGPGQAITMAGAWLGDWRMHRRVVREQEARPSTDEDAPAGEVLESVVELGETSVSEVMVPRGEIRALPESARVRDWAELAVETRHGNLPVYRSDLDEILGYVALEDLLRATDEDAPVTGFLRDARFVPETMRGDDLLRELIAQGERMAIVVDEFGGTAGLVRERDLFEILLGEIDRGSAAAVPRRLEPGVFVADGTCRVDDFAEATGHALPEGDYETLAGLVLQRLGRIPAAGESVVVEGVRIEVQAASERRILRVRVTLPAAGSGGAARGDR
jgi:CBS domain containing-hemolysin-like protein